MTTYPVPLFAAHFAGILAHLGWDTEYAYKDLKKAVNDYLESTDLSESEIRLIHTNFIHTSIDHSDMMMAYYGCKTKWSRVDTERGPDIAVSFSPYTP